MSFIGIDLGTSFIKGAVLNTDTLRPEQVLREPFPAALANLPPVFREYDVAVILDRVRSLLDRLVPLAGDCQGILWSTQMHGCVLVDEQGRPRSNLMTWLDQRVNLPHPAGGTHFEVLTARLTPEERRELGGTELRPGLPVGSLFWLAESGQLPAGKLTAVALADYVVMALSGSPPRTDLTNAQAHGLLNLRTLAWHHSVIEKLGLADLGLPQIQPQGAIVGELHFGGRTLPLYTPVGDFQCSAAGALLEPGDLWLNISTGSQVSLPLAEPRLGQFQTRPFFDGQYLATVTTIPAGRALNALVKLLSELAVAHGAPIADPWAYISRAVENASEPRLAANVSFFASAVGESGALTNLREEEMTVGHLFRAAFHNMADNYFECANRLPRELPRKKLVFSGGLVQKMELLRQFIAARFGLPYRYCPVAEDAMQGLLVLGLSFSGRARSFADATRTVRASFGPLA